MGEEVAATAVKCPEASSVDREVECKNFLNAWDYWLRYSG